MKRILSFLLCATLLFSVVSVTGSAAEEANPERDAVVADIISGITALKTPTRDSREDLKTVNKKINDFCYNYGYYNDDLITNLYAFDTAIKKFNDLMNYSEGDVNNDTKIDAKDALDVLKFSVGKIILDQKQKFAADVDFDEQHNAKDALMLLQFAVGKRSEFPSQVVDHTPYEKEEPLNYTAKGLSLYQETYQSMVDRIEKNGYTQTSLTGAYEGMYLRDASIQVLAHVTNGDFDEARSILNYITEYHRMKGLGYIMYIIRTHNAYHKQTDTTFFFLHSWVQFAMNAPKTEENRMYIESSYSKIAEFANYYLDNGYLRDEYDLLYNESFEHSRDGSYFQSYDLVTNVFASQALYELSEYFKTIDPTNAKKWADASARIADGIHKNLTVECKGELMYAEFYGTKKSSAETVPETEKKFYAGLSWVNLAPMGCDWYAAKPEILEHTYQIYLEYGSARYYAERYKMLDVYSDLNVKMPRRLNAGNHIIGKGLAWELMYCAKTGKADRLAELNEFIEDNSTKYYPEVWAYGGGVNDSANQEQASWLLVAQKTNVPQLKSK